MQIKGVLQGILLMLAAASLYGQESTEPPERLRKDAVKLFIDCQHCDMDYIRREIPYVNYVREVKEAEVYILETNQRSGSGGQEYTYFFQGQNKFAGLNDTLIYSSRPDDTRDHVREGRTDMLKMGLMRYVARTPIFKEVDISHTGEVEEEVADRWNNWIFELETRPDFEIEEFISDISFRNSASAVKVTEDWKLEFDFDYNISREKFISDDTTYVADRNSQRFDNLIVRSINDHWSVGGQLDYLASTFSNYKLRVNIIPSVEYDIFPYSESTHRQLRILYGVGYSHNIYNDSTIYNKLEDLLFKHSLEMAYQVQEKWGSVNISLQASNYLHDFSKNRIELEGSIRIRLLKGLSFNIYGGVARIRDQLALGKEEISEAERLLELQELATGYSIDGGMGLTYTFGSIYNNVVNPRFGNGGFYRR